MIRFFDASALVKRYVREDGSRIVADRLRRGRPAVSRLSRAEVTSAICRRGRLGDLSARERDRLLHALEEDFRRLLVLEVTASVVDRAVDLLVRHPLRAADALQLASGLLLRERTGDAVGFVAFDGPLNRAAAAEGLQVESVD